MTTPKATTLALLFVASCSSGDAPQLNLGAQPVIGQCTRDELVLRGPQATCAVDTDCPCGSYCDTAQHLCAFECMVPPANQAESCGTGTQCDDTGRCVAPGDEPPSVTAVLGASPSALYVVPGGPAKSLAVTLTAYSSSAATTAQTTVVRVIGQNGTEVTCDATTYGSECELASWTFAFDGTRYVAQRPIGARNPTGSTGGDVLLRIDELDASVVVPVIGGAAQPARDGRYRGAATSDQLVNGIDVEAIVRGSTVLLRDPSRVIAPDGALVLDLVTDATPTTARPVTWLTPLAGPTGAIVGEYQAGQATVSSTGAITLPFTISLPGAQTATWSLELARAADLEVACTADSQCGSGNVCPAALQVCVPSAVWTPAAQPVANLFEDPRSAQWWAALEGSLGTGDTVVAGATEAFATTGADLIETLMCTQDATDANAGRLGVTQVKFGSGPSRSGDLACVGGNGLPNSGAGAVGLVTRFDRRGDASSAAMLATCLQELARPVTNNFQLNYGPNIGECVNLARFVPALRLLATGERDKRTSTADPRARTLFTRLVQQWSQLHGFLASTGLSDREYDDAVAASPAEARQEMLALLDVLDAGWAALLDKRVAPLFPDAAAWAPTGANDHADYRLAKKPVAYWPLNGTTPRTDIVNSAVLNTHIKGIYSTECSILATRNSFAQTWNCSGYHATLPASAPRVDAGNLSIGFHLALPYLQAGQEIIPYAGGAIATTETMAIVQSVAGGRFVLGVVHPTVGGGTEWVAFDDYAQFGTGRFDGVGTGGGSTAMIVRDTVAKTYTLYIWKGPGANDYQVFTQSYLQTVGGTLSNVAAGKVLFGAGPPGTLAAPEQWVERRSQAGFLDDLAIFKTAISKREFLRFARGRGYNDTLRAAWPQDMTLVDYQTQEITTPVGAALLEAQAAHLDVVARLVEHVQYQVQTACDDTSAAGATARSELQAVVARAGRTLRQSTVIEGFALDDQTQRAEDARQLLAAKRGRVARGLQRLATCENPYGMADGEVPLYFGSIAPNANESDAFFAASNHLLALAEQRTALAQSALSTVQTRWDQARQSQLQQLVDSTSRAVRVDEVKARYGEGLRSLCGIAGQTTDQIMQSVMAGQFDVDSCFVHPTTSCTSNQQGPIMDADPSCYRGALGAALMDMRTAYHAQQAAFQSWQAAVGNAKAAEKLCVLQEMDLYGCSALDRHELEGVSCPSGHQGTIALVAAYRQKVRELQETRSIFDTIVGTISTIAATTAAAVATGPGAAFVTAGLGSLKMLEPQFDMALDELRASHESMLALRSAEAQIRACWTEAEQYGRAISAAEEGSKAATAKLQTSSIAFQNALGQARELVHEAPIVVDRELNRPSLPIAFHYWLPDEIQNYRFLMDGARRYTYVALRATEYDTLTTYKTATSGRPLRATVLGAWRPNTLSQQLQLMRDQTNTRTTVFGPPALGHITFDFGQKFFGLPESSLDFGPTLDAYARPVYSKQGEYLGRGVAFSFVPSADAEPPTWRCAERIWRANVGTAGYPSSSASFHLKLVKRNVFASRRCDAPGFQAATLRPSANLLMAAGEPQTYVPESTSSVADISVLRLDTPNALQDFRTLDNAYNASSTELSLQGLYGDYVLLFPVTALDAGLDLRSLFDFNLRFDFVSVDDTPELLGRMFGDQIRFERATTPIVVD